jgi:hypothetical protein
MRLPRWGAAGAAGAWSLPLFPHAANPAIAIVIDVTRIKCRMRPFLFILL